MFLSMYDKVDGSLGVIVPAEYSGRNNNALMDGSGHCAAVSTWLLTGVKLGFLLMNPDVCVKSLFNGKNQVLKVKKAGE